MTESRDQDNHGADANAIESPSGHSLRGAYLALVAAALFGASAPLAKSLLASITPQLLAGFLYIGSGVGLTVFRLVRGARAEAPLTRTDVPWLSGAIAFGGIVGPVLLMIGLTRTPASGASLLLNLEGVFTACLAWFVFQENVDRRIALGMLAIVAGGIVLTWEGHASWGGVIGPLAIAGACLSWAADNNLTQKVSGGDPAQIAMLKGLVAGGVNTAIALGRGAQLPVASPLAAALVVGFLSYGVSLVMYVLALRHLGTARTGAYFSTAPFVGAALSLIAFRERPTNGFVTAAALMAIGVWLHLSERHEHEHVHDPMDHAHAHVHDEHHRHEHVPGDPPVTDPKPHTHAHHHGPLAHSHPHYPDIHHRHGHSKRL
jgi:drug/metabolite transporter (DMT)-like permease